MVSVLFVWNRLKAYAQKYQSGADNVDYFNTALAEVQLEIFTDFSPSYDKNEMVKSLLDFWVRPQKGTSNPDGTVGLGTGNEVVARPLGIGYTDGTIVLFGVPQVQESELMAIARMPQRVPNVAKKQVYYRFNSPSVLNFYPETTIPYSLFYIIYPLEAKIVFTFTSTADEDIMTYDPVNSIDLAWPESASNLIVYKMLEKYGVTVREQLLQEYSKYGVVTSSMQSQEGRVT